MPQPPIPLTDEITPPSALIRADLDVLLGKPVRQGCTRRSRPLSVNEAFERTA
jgi:hypothetical protein